MRDAVGLRWLVERPIAHRGLHRGSAVPENSMAAFRAAVEAGFPIELDIRLSCDGEAVVFHDRDLFRLTGVQGLMASFEGLTDLRLLGGPERIPLLREVLAMVDGRVPLLIETKPEEVGPLEEALVRDLAGYAGPFAVQSFEAKSLARLPGMARGWLSTGSSEIPELADFVGLAVEALPLYARYVRNQGLPLLAWTVRTPEEMRLAREYADNAIFETPL